MPLFTRLGSKSATSGVNSRACATHVLAERMDAEELLELFYECCPSAGKVVLVIKQLGNLHIQLGNNP